MTGRTISAKHWLAFAALGVVWGSTWIATDTLSEQIPPLLGEAARFALAALLCVPVILLKHQKLPRGRSLAVVLLLSVTMIVLPFLLLLWDRQQVPSATVAVLFAAMPLLVVLLTPGLEGGGVPRSAMQAAIVAVGALVLTVGATFSLTQAGGAAVGLLAVFLIGASSLVARRELAGVNALPVTAVLLGSAAPLLWIASMVLEREQRVQWNGSAVAAVIFLAVASAVAYPIYFWLLQALEAYQVATLQWFQPLVGLLETAIFLRLRLSLTMMAGVLITLLSLWVALHARPEDDDTVSLLGN